MPSAGNPQALNRYAYGLNNPVKYVDPTGHCAGLLGWVRGLPGYATTCDNLGLANDIAHDDRASVPEKALAVAYIGAEVASHAAAVVGAAGVACGLTPACAAAVEPILGIGATSSAACAATNCVNPVNNAAGPATTEATAVVARQVTALGNQADTIAARLKDGANILNVPDRLWSWDLNKKFLDNAVMNNDIIKLVTDPDKWRTFHPNSWLFKELEYLETNWGYKLVGDEMVRDLDNPLWSWMKTITP